MLGWSCGWGGLGWGAGAFAVLVLCAGILLTGGVFFLGLALAGFGRESEGLEGLFCGRSAQPAQAVCGRSGLGWVAPPGWVRLVGFVCTGGEPDRWEVNDQAVCGGSGLGWGVL